MAGFFNFARALVGMPTEHVRLDFREQQDAPLHSLYQLDNGAQFYYDGADKTKPKRLYLKWRGEEFDVTLPPGNDHSGLKMNVYGNSLYLFNERKFYRVEFTPTTRVSLTFIRSQLEDEEVHCKFNVVLCSRIRDGEQHVYGMCDNPEIDGICADLSGEELKDLELFCIHRGTLFYIYSKSTRWDTPKKLFLGHKLVKLVVGEMPNACKAYCQDSSPYIYITDYEKVQVLDTETWKFLTEIHAPKPGFFEASVYSRQVYALWTNLPFRESRSRVLIAKLPRGYYDDETTINQNNDSTRKIGGREYQLNFLQSDSINDPMKFSSKFLSEFTVKNIRGEGGFGCVFEVMNNIDHGDYAVKRVAVQDNKLDKALAEVRAMAKLDHPGIVRYNATWIENPPEGWQHDADIEIINKMEIKRRNLMNFQGNSVFIYIQMQLCDYSLSDWLKENGQPSSRDPHRMKGWFKQLVSAVEYIHGKNLIHRDLKPSNILFAEKDLLKLCDLGIATERNNDDAIKSTIDRSLQGTLLYMSPEQRSLLPYSSKSDVFTLGLILLELLVVLTATERSEMFDRIRAGNHVNVVKDEITAKFVEKLVQVKPENRPTCREMLDHLFLA